LHANLRHSPVITAMVIFQRPLALPFNAAYVVGDSRLAWVSNNNMKVGKNVAFKAGSREFWTFMAPAQYSCDSFGSDGKGYKQRAFNDFVTAFGEILGMDLWSHSPSLVRALHWEAGLPCTTLPSNAGCLYDSEQRLGWCGHWAVHGSVEGAALSGRRMAELIAGVSLGRPPPVDAEYPEGMWPDIGHRAENGYVRLSNGFFYLQHPRLKSIPPPISSLSAVDTEAFWSQHAAWGFGGTARSQGSDKGHLDKGHAKGCGRWRQNVDKCSAAPSEVEEWTGQHQLRPQRRWLTARGRGGH